MAAPERAGSAGGMNFGLGVSSIDPIGGAGGSLTGILAFTQLDALQILASIPGTAGSFRFGVGGIYKRTIVGNQGAGLHLGGGLGLGSTTSAAAGGDTDFAMNILGNIGVHYAPGGSDIVFHLDGGPVFGLQKTTTTAAGVSTSTTTTDFRVGQLSSILGASVVYMF